MPKGIFVSVVVGQDGSAFFRGAIEWDHIIFQWLGDPLLHPQLPDLIEMAQVLKDQVNYSRVDTNCIQLTERRAERLLQTAQKGTPVLLVCSLDALSGSVYEKVKGFPMRDVVYRNIRKMIRLRRQLGGQPQPTTSVCGSARKMPRRSTSVFKLLDIHT